MLIVADISVEELLLLQENEAPLYPCRKIVSAALSWKENENEDTW